MKHLLTPEQKEARRVAVAEAKLTFNPDKLIPSGGIARRLKGKHLSPTQFYKNDFKP